MSRGGGWRAHRDEQEFAGLTFLREMKEQGHHVQAFSPYHLRIDDEIDFWPRGQKWRHKHGNYEGIGIKKLRIKLKSVEPRHPRQRPDVIYLPGPVEPRVEMPNDEVPF